RMRARWSPGVSYLPSLSDSCAIHSCRPSHRRHRTGRFSQVGDYRCVARGPESRLPPSLARQQDMRRSTDLREYHHRGIRCDVLDDIARRVPDWTDTFCAPHPSHTERRPSGVVMRQMHPNSWAAQWATAGRLQGETLVIPIDGLSSASEKPYRK